MAKSGEDNPNRSAGPSIVTTVLYVLAVIAIVGIGAVASVYDPEQRTAILAFCGSILVALVPIMRGYQEIHVLINSQLDNLLNVTEEAFQARGEEIGREAQRVENQQADQDQKC